MARYLLDTHALLWWWDSSPKLPDHIGALMGDRSHLVFVSAISGLEIAIKVRLGKLPWMASKIDAFNSDVTGDGFEHLDVTGKHTVRAGVMGGHHRDPFDRVLAAQALLEDLILVTRDREIATFGCKTVW